MKLVRYGEPGAERPGVIGPNGTLRDASALVDDWAGPVLGRLEALEGASLPAVPEQAPRLGVPVGGIGKIVCVGLNYTDLAVEYGVQPPREPVLFLKASSALCGPHDPLVLPRESEKADWEVELGVVIGRPGKYIEEARALEHVAGYVTFNDISDRSFQIERAGQWTKGKSADSFAPMGPWLVTRAALPDPQALWLRLWQNGEIRQDGNTGQMIFPVARIIAYVSCFMSLQPGDVIATGTPAGIGMGQRPPLFLQPGDIIEAEVEGLGRQRQEVVAEA
jgi:2-keto-4-pentenoate hydratase/2-oxohepta-3-ene-1,7-dioic acid hydratase in catechol pathway